MSGPNPPGREPEEPDPAAEPSEPESLGEEFDGDLDDELNPVDDLDHADDFDDGGGHADATDAYSQAYSAPESELFVSGRYVPADLALYDYDGYEDFDDDHAAPRWPWVVGVTAILAAIALVAAVSVLVARTDTSKLASPGATTTTSSTPPVQDQITTTKPPPPSSEPPPTSVPPPPPSEVPTATETQTVTVTPAPAPAPVPPAPTSAPPPASSPAAAPPPVTTTTPAGPRQVTYSVTGTKRRVTSFRSPTSTRPVDAGHSTTCTYRGR